jgi:hypothetical protein
LDFVHSKKKHASRKAVFQQLNLFLSVWGVEDI